MTPQRFPIETLFAANINVCLELLFIFIDFFSISWCFSSQSTPLCWTRTKRKTFQKSIHWFNTPTSAFLCSPSPWSPLTGQSIYHWFILSLFFFQHIKDRTSPFFLKKKTGNDDSVFNRGVERCGLSLSYILLHSLLSPYSSFSIWEPYKQR